MPEGFERFDSYQELLSSLENERDKLYRESAEKRQAADILTRVCADLRTAVEYEKSHYKSVERT